jgi:primosomal replication protein N
MSERDRPPYLPAIAPPSRPSVPDYVPHLDSEHAAADLAPPVAGAAIPQEKEPPVPVPQPEAPATPERPRSVLTGRVGRQPVFDTTPTGKPRVRFPLAMHPTPEATAWHRVYALGEHAQRLRGKVERGQEVEVIGFHQARQLKRKDGTLRTVDEFYAVAVRLTGKADPKR